jgi:indole-3-glycerol phosphate synthase
MANVLDESRLSGFHDLARELGMEALFEVHTAEEIRMLPAGARIVGINSRKFQSDSGFVATGGSSEKDFSLDRGVFELVGELPAAALKVAESGIDPSTLGGVREKFDAALVGTSLLRDPRGVRACLRDFEEAILGG